MQMRFPKKVGNKTYSFEVNGENLFDLVFESQKLSFRDITKCGKCESENLYLSAYLTKEEQYKYVKVICGKCRASATFGQPKANPDTYYLRRNQDGSIEWKEYTGKDEKKETKTKTETEVVNPNDVDW